MSNTCNKQAPRLPFRSGNERVLYVMRTFCAADLLKALLCRPSHAACRSLHLASRAYPVCACIAHVLCLGVQWHYKPTLEAGGSLAGY